MNATPANANAPKTITAPEYENVKDSVRRLLKVDLDHYKSNQMIRRLSSFIEREKCSSVSEFCTRLTLDNELRRKLKDFLTINVTEFFRDTAQFAALEKGILPQLLARAQSPRIWSAGSSRGAEAYSVAILLHEVRPGLKYRLLGTDLDEQVVQAAKSGGPFSEADVRGVTPARISRYFIKTSDGYFVKNELKPNLEFRTGDLLKDRFESHFDLILCRNVVIYFSDEAKAMLNAKFSASLKDDGFLFIGATETIFDAKAFGLERVHTAFLKKTGRPSALAA